MHLIFVKWLKENEPDAEFWKIIERALIQYENKGSYSMRIYTIAAFDILQRWHDAPLEYMFLDVEENMKDTIVVEIPDKYNNQKCRVINSSSDSEEEEGCSNTTVPKFHKNNIYKTTVYTGDEESLEEGFFQFKSFKTTNKNKNKNKNKHKRIRSQKWNGLPPMKVVWLYTKSQIIKDLTEHKIKISREIRDRANSHLYMSNHIQNEFFLEDGIKVEDISDRTHFTDTEQNKSLHVQSSGLLFPYFVLDFYDVDTNVVEKKLYNKNGKEQVDIDIDNDIERLKTIEEASSWRKRLDDIVENIMHRGFDKHYKKWQEILQKAQKGELSIEFKQIKHFQIHADEKYSYETKICAGCGLTRYLNWAVCVVSTCDYTWIDGEFNYFMGGDCKFILDISHRMTMHNCENNPQDLIDEYLDYLDTSYINCD